MSKLLNACETTVSPSYRLFGLVDTSVDTFTPDADRSNWLLPAFGVVYLQVPSEVINAFIRLESWSTAPPVPSARWSGREEVELVLPEGELGIATIDGGVDELNAFAIAMAGCPLLALLLSVGLLNRALKRHRLRAATFRSSHILP